jgi:saccharopine dehydrogenase-like NADP-dependent oxidoreductase
MSWSPRVIVDELASPPLVFRGGKFGNVKAFSGAETFAFPRPFGRRRVVAVYGDEVATLPLYLKVRDVDMKSGGTDIDFGAALAAAGLLDDRTIAVGRERVRPRDLLELVAPKVPTPAEMRKLVERGRVRNSWLVAAVEADGSAGGNAVTRSATAVFPDLRQVMKLRPGATYVAYPTALCAAAMSAAVPRIGRAGAMPPEALDRAIRRTVLRELKDAGVFFVRRGEKG